MKLSIAAKLIGALALTTLTTLAVALLGLQAIANLYNDTTKLQKEDRTLALVSDLRSNTMEMTQHMTALIAQARPELQAREVRHHVRELSQIAPQLKQELANDPQALGAVRKVLGGAQQLINDFQRGAMNATSDPAVNQRQILRLVAIKEGISAANDELNALVLKHAEHIARDAESAHSSAQQLQIAVLIIGVLVCVLLGWLLVRAIVPPIRRYGQFVSRVGQGDLSSRVEVRGSDDLSELGHSINTMVDQLRDVTTSLATDAEQVAGAAKNILAAVSQQTASASEQSASITETSTAVEEVRASAELAAEKAGGVADQAQSSTEVGQRGAEAMHEIGAGMAAIREKVQAIAHDITTLSQHTGQIEEITRSVSDLADQSNLLALNATIEAARAGEQGKGFAVVADEVRNLAEQSKQATTQVQALLQEIQTATAAAVRDAEAGRDVVNSAADQIDQAGVIIAQLVDANAQAAQAAQQIAASAAEQNVGMDQIAQAMTETQNATTQLVQGAEESRKAAEQLHEVAGQLREIASRFQS